MSEFRLSQPPRSVPMSLAIVTATGSKIAWFVLAFSSLFFWFFCARADLSFLTFQPPIEQVQGTVTNIRHTGASENRQSILGVEYSYRARGEQLQGISYVTGDAPEVGAHVNVEYSANTPSRSRIEGMRRDLWTPWILFLALFPFGCLIVVILTVRTGLRRLRLLRLGMLTTGKLTKKRRTNTQINKQPVYELIFAFDAYDGRPCTATARTHLTERLEDEREEPLLYDPLDPTQAFMLDSLPSRPQLDEAGNLRGSSAVAVAFSLLVPAIAIGLNLLLFALRIKG